MNRSHHLRQWIPLAILVLALLFGSLLQPASAQTQNDETSTSVAAPSARIAAKLKTISFGVNFDKMDIATVLEFLSKKSRELDPDKQGINFVLLTPDDAAKNTSGPQAKIHREVSLTLDSISLGDLLQEISEQTNLQYSIEEYAIVFHPIK
jgi:type II secretory pathway component GspD/PulD (secretin)